MTKSTKEKDLNNYIYQTFLGNPIEQKISSISSINSGGKTILLKEVYNELNNTISKFSRPNKKPRAIQETLDGDFNNKRPSPSKSN